MLYLLSAIFYFAAAAAGLAAVIHGSSGGVAWLPFDIAGIVSALFFGAMCSAAQRAIDLLLSIAKSAEHLRPPADEKTQRQEREEAMARVARWQD